MLSREDSVEATELDQHKTLKTENKIDKSVHTEPLDHQSTAKLQEDLMKFYESFHIPFELKFQRYSLIGFNIRLHSENKWSGDKGSLIGKTHEISELRNGFRIIFFRKLSKLHSFYRIVNVFPHLPLKNTRPTLRIG